MMKRKYFSEKLLALAAALCMCFSSCMDNVDLNNLSTDMKLGGKLAMPIGSTEFTVKDLLERYNPDSANSIKVGVDDEKVVMLYVENVMTYETPDLSDKFKALTENVMSYSMETQPHTLKDIGFNVGVTPNLGDVTTHEANMPFDFNKLNDKPAEQEITKIVFNSTDVKVLVNTYGKEYPKGFLLITVQLPGTEDSIVIDASQNSIVEKKKNLTVKMENQTSILYPVKFKITGDGRTKIETNDRINVSIAFTKSDYVVYGYFYYNDGKKQMNPYKADLFSYLPEGTDLRFFAPSFKFDVTSNIGIPFVFDLDAITSYVHGKSPNPVKVNLQKDSVISSAPNPTADITSTITIDKTSFPNDDASSIFNTSLDSLSAAYTFKAPAKGSALITGEQFIAPNSRIKMTASAQLPFWLDAGSVIAYADTLDGIDVEDYEYITNASLIFTYTSQLPLGFDIAIALLDSSKNEISVKNPNNYKHSIKAAPVDDHGKVKQGSSAPQGSFTISYDSSTIEDLKKAKFLVVNVKAKGAESTSKIKITNNDKLSIKAGLTVEGGLTVKN